MNSPTLLMRKFFDMEVTLGGGLRVSLPLFTVFITTLITNGIGLIGASAYFQPDSGGYIASALNILKYGDFHGIGLNRVPGYSSFLAAVMAVFGQHFMLGLMVVQHLMMVLISIMVFKIGGEVDHTGRVGFAAGIFSAFSLQLQAYANLPMSEVLFTTLCLFGLWMGLRVLRVNAPLPLLLSALTFSFATLVRPSGQMLALLVLSIPLFRALFPSLRVLFPGGVFGNRRAHLLHFFMGAVVVAAVLVPWMGFNKKVYDYFGITATFGLNLYSNTVEYGNFWDDDSPAIAEIKKRWKQGEEIRVASGALTETKMTWRNHWPSVSRYINATNTNLAVADKVYLRAAIDAIKAHPGKFLKQVIRNIFGDLYYAEPIYQYLPGLSLDDTPPFLMRHMLSIEIGAGVKDVIADLVDNMTSWEGEPIHFDQPNGVTPLYGMLATAYHSVVIRGMQLILFLAIGVCVALYHTIRKKDLAWFMVLAFLGYLIVVPGIMVPGSPRHRLPADPMIDIMYALAAVSIMRAFLCLVRQRTKGGLAAYFERHAFSGPTRFLEFVEKYRLKEGLILVLIIYLAFMSWWFGSLVYLAAFFAVLLIYII